MGINYSQLLYGPTFTVLSVNAVLQTGTEGDVALRVIDKTDGSPAFDNRYSTEIDGGAVHIIKPYCVAMVKELEEASVTVEELDGSIITFNGGTWRIESHAFLPSPGGQGDGQLAMYLVEGEA